jgi:NAD(P)-dependent dehydrogenase (short-subunit alcohol dehydrogenase family)
VTARSLEGKRIIVTGAGRGLGRSYAMCAAQAGALVVVNDVSAADANEVVELIAAAGGTAVASINSVADAEQASAILAQCVDTFGGIDGLVNNAGLYHEALAWDEDFDRLRSLVEVNLLGTMFCGALVARELKRQGHGSIVNVSSGSSLGLSRTSGYSATKGAIAALTYGWALDFADTDVRVNCISPNAWTDMARATELTRANGSPELHPDRIGPLVVYLLSDLSADVRGQFIRFNGEQLHLVSPPRFAEPVITREQWDVDAIADAFESQLSARQLAGVRPDMRSDGRY